MDVNYTEMSMQTHAARSMILCASILPDCPVNIGIFDKKSMVFDEA